MVRSGAVFLIGILFFCSLWLGDSSLLLLHLGRSALLLLRFGRHRYCSGRGRRLDASIVAPLKLAAAAAMAPSTADQHAALQSIDPPPLVLCHTGMARR